MSRHAGMAAQLGVALGGAVIAVLAWSVYRSPAMGLLLEAFRFCG